jgi:LysM repeat protein
MKYSPQAAVIGIICLLSSCEREGKTVVPPQQAVSQATPDSRWQEGDFTPWMSRAELQHFQNTSPSDQYFAHVEGRNSSGRLEYRAVVMPFTGEQYEQWAVFWGIDEAELFKCEMNLLESGFVRHDMQVFADQTGTSVHQIVWLKSKMRVGDQGQNPVSEVIPASSLAETPPAAIIPVAPSPPAEPVRQAVVQEAPVAQRVPESPVKTDVGSDVPEDRLSKSSKNSTYVVKQGDTLGKIAKTAKITVGELKTINHLKSDVLRIGQKLTISAEAK